MEIRELDSDSRKRAKHILLQHARLGKEVLLGFREGNSLTQFQVKKFGAAYEIGNLEQAVIARRDVLYEKRRRFRESSLEDAVHLGLAVVIVDFHPSVRRKTIVGIGKEGGYLVAKRFLHGGRRGAVSLVDDEGVVGDWGVKCECEKLDFGNPKKIKLAGRYPRLRVARAYASAKSQIAPAVDSVSNRRRRRKGEKWKLWNCGNEERNVK